MNPTENERKVHKSLPQTGPRSELESVLWLGRRDLHVLKSAAGESGRGAELPRGTRMAMELELIPPGTRLEANGEGMPFDISSTTTRTFLCRLNVADQIEQESLEVSIWGSPDGANWGTKPLLKLPQQFYRGDAKMVLDLSLRPEIRFLRARWELNRWGRVAPTPMFVAGLDLTEVPPMSRETPTKRRMLAP